MTTIPGRPSPTLGREGRRPSVRSVVALNAWQGVQCLGFFVTSTGMRAYSFAEIWPTHSRCSGISGGGFCWFVFHPWSNKAIRMMVIKKDLHIHWGGRAEGKARQVYDTAVSG